MIDPSNLVAYETTVADKTVPIEMAWVDLETTGLTDDDKMLEVGIMLTDRWGIEHSSFRSLVVSAGTLDRLDEMVPIVQEMHSKSGLREEIEVAIDQFGELVSPIALGNVERMLVDFVQRAGVPAGQLPLAGSSVHFDHALLNRHMPTFSGWFTHRNIDVSTIRGLCKMHNRPVYDKRMKQIEGVEVSHRVLDDIRMSIEEYLFYVDNFLFTV